MNLDQGFEEGYGKGNVNGAERSVQKIGCEVSVMLKISGQSFKED